MESNNIVISNIYTILHARGISQASLAFSIGVPPTSMSRWMTGARKMSFATVVRIAKGLGVAVEELTKDPTTPAVNIYPKDIKKLVDLLVTLNKAGQMKVEEYIFDLHPRYKR